MTKKRKGRKVLWARRMVQTVCLVLALWLFWAAGFRDESEASKHAHIFFRLDPLVLIATWLAARAVPAVAALAIVTVVLTVLLGRVFCGWVCPLGTVHHAATWLAHVFSRKRRKAQPYTGMNKAKYYLLAGLLTMALFGAHWIGVFDPISQFYRVVTTVLYPATQYAVEDGATAVYHADPHLGPAHLTSVTEPANRVLKNKVFGPARPAFTGTTLIGLLFAAMIVLNAFRRRFWCRYLCPLGALLGWLSRRPVLRLVNVPEPCKECGQCATVCPAGASPEKPGEWKPSECFGCWNCVPSCKFDALNFAFRSPLTKPTEAKLDLGKRATLAAGAGGVAGLLLFRLDPQAQARVFNPSLIRPPGAREERQFLKRCLQCGLCMQVCPTNGLQPAGFFDAGLEGLWTPKLVPRIGYCEYGCNQCGQACPTEAIKPLLLEEKHEVKIGLASFDTTRCLPWAYDRNCLICEEHCPLSPKAIYFRPKEVTKRNGQTIVLKQPYVDADRCIGCGICEAKCVFRDRPAIRVTSANETRHADDNQPILPSLDGGDFVPVPESGPDGADPYGSGSETDQNPYG